MKFFYKYLILLFLFPQTGFCANIDTGYLIKQVVRSIENLNNTRYNYTLKASYPTGETDQMKGAAYIDIADKILFNDCDAFTVFLNGHWMYKADHRKKELTIINMDKQGDRKYNKEFTDHLQDLVKVFFGDSVLLSKARIGTYMEQGDLRKIEFKFPSYLHISAIDVVMNIKTDQILSYDMYVSEAYARDHGNAQSIKQTIKCSDFEVVGDKSKYKLSQYFSYTKGKLMVTKYNNYKLFSKI